MTGEATASTPEKKRMTLAEFWPRYALAHQAPGTRWLHLIGIVSGVSLFTASAVLLDWRLLVAGLVVGYGFAWTGHFLIEHNKPATFGHPFLSFASDFKMVFYMLTGRMKAEIDRARQQQQS